jgi:hypothetical protein
MVEEEEELVQENIGVLRSALYIHEYGHGDEVALATENEVDHSCHSPPPLILAMADVNASPLWKHSRTLACPLGCCGHQWKTGQTICDPRT